VEGLWPIFFPSLVPVTYLLYLVWCVIRQEPEVQGAPPEADDHDPPHWRRNPHRPRGPRRGPHGPDAQPVPSSRQAPSACSPPRPRRGPLRHTSSGSIGVELNRGFRSRPKSAFDERLLTGIHRALP